VLPVIDPSAGSACHGRLSCDLAALGRPELWISFTIGVAALAAGLPASAGLRRARAATRGAREAGGGLDEATLRHRPAPGRSPASGAAEGAARSPASGAARSPAVGVAGLLLSVAGLVALGTTGRLVPGLVAAVVLLVLGAGAAATGFATGRPAAADAAAGRPGPGGPAAGGPAAGGAAAGGAAAGGAAARTGAPLRLRHAWSALPPAGRRVLASLPGAAVLAFGTRLPAPLAARLLAGAVVVLVAATLPGLERRHRGTGLGPVLFAVSAVGCYETVPTPDLALVVVGVSVPLALLAWPRPLARLGRSGPAAVAILAWAAVAGGQGRPVTMVTGLACLGLLLVEPLAALLGRHTRPPRRPLGRLRPGAAGTALAAGGQLVLVAALSQAYPLSGGGAGAVLLSLGLLALTAGVLVSRGRPGATTVHERTGPSLG